MQDFMFVQPGNAIDRVANRVVFGEMEHFNITPRPCMIHSDRPIPCKKIMEPFKNDLTGFKDGMLTVIGLYKKANNGSGRSWVVRCVCGNYEVRRGKTLKKNLELRDSKSCCSVCEQRRRLKEGHYHPKGNEYD